MAAKKARKKSTESSRTHKVAREVYGAQMSKKEVDQIRKTIDSSGPDGMEAAKRAARRFVKKLGKVLDNGPTVTKSGKPKGRNPHVGLKIPKTSDEELVARRRAARKKKPGTVRAVNKREGRQR